MNAEATIGPIAGVTLAVSDLPATEHAYVRYLGYRVNVRGRISAAQAGAWKRPAAAGSRYVTLRPEAGADFEFRFVEVAGARNYRAFSTFGWNAAELIVRDVDALADQLADSPFAILGPPQDLSFTDAIRAMQIRGPSGEILYLTQFKRPLETLPFPPARCHVDRVFIVIVGGHAVDDLVDYYTTAFAVPAPQRMESRVKAMSEVFGLSPEHRFRIAALPVQGRCYIEVDEMPPSATPPQISGDNLPPGIALVSFCSADRASIGCVTGRAGELIEIVAR
jgi:hypothetical protein